MIPTWTWTPIFTRSSSRCEASSRPFGQERDRAAALQAEVASLTAEAERNYQQVERIAQSEVPDDDGIATMVYWDTYFRARQGEPR
jgi:hypothetical protein